MTNVLGGIRTALWGLLLTGCLAAQPRDILFQAQRPGGTEDIYALRVRDLGIRAVGTTVDLAFRSAGPVDSAEVNAVLGP